MTKVLKSYENIQFNENDVLTFAPGQCIIMYSVMQRIM